MAIEKYFNKESILDDLTADNKEGAIREMCAHIFNKDKELVSERFIDKVLDREKLGSTGLGSQIAIPHAYLESINGLVLSFARSIPGIDFNSLDGEKTHYIFLVGAGPENVNAYLNVLADISTMFDNTELKEQLSKAVDREDLFNIFKQYHYMKEEISQRSPIIP